MNHVSKAVFVTLMMTLALTSAFAKHVIELTLDSAGNLYPTNRGDATAGWLGQVFWVIRDKNIESFQIVEKPGNTDYIFTEPLPSGFQKDLLRKVKFRFRGCDWYYSINWKDAQGNVHPYDPKIAVKPVVPFTDLIFLFGFIITLLTTIVFYRRWQAAERIVKKYEQNK